MIDLDNNNSTKPCSAAIERFNSYLQNPSKVAADAIYELVGALPQDRFVLTGSGAEAVNHVFWSVYLERARKQGKTHIIISSIEDFPSIECAKLLEELGCTIKIAPVDEEGRIDVKQLYMLINPRTALISISMAHGLTGVIQPFEEIAKMAKEKGVLLHLEASHTVGKFFFSFHADYLTFAGDLIHGLQSGALFVKEGVPYTPLVLGAKVNAPLLMSLQASANQAFIYLDTMALEVARLRDLFEEEVGGRVLSKNAMRLPNTTAIAFEGVHQEALLYMLQRKGVKASCAATHFTKFDETAVSFSLSRMTTEEEVMKAAKIVKEVVGYLQGVSAGL